MQLPMSSEFIFQIITAQVLSWAFQIHTIIDRYKGQDKSCIGQTLTQFPCSQMMQMLWTDISKLCCVPLHYLFRILRYLQSIFRYHYLFHDILFFKYDKTCAVIKVGIVLFDYQCIQNCTWHCIVFSTFRFEKWPIHVQPNGCDH